jgi:hypothetical protein
MTSAPSQTFFSVIWGALGGSAAGGDAVSVVGDGNLPSVFRVSDLAAASVSAAAAALAELVGARHGSPPSAQIDRRLASLWFGTSLRPDGWSVPPVWDVTAGDYRTSDGWIRLHTNSAHHRVAALGVLGTPAERTAVAEAVARWSATELETAIVNANGCAAAMRSTAAWAAHPQGRAVSAEPLVQVAETDHAPPPEWPVPHERPLQGVRVLDLTRILAGPIATRFLAGFGAEVLRIDPPGWEEPGIIPEVSLGKRCATLDLREPAQLQHLERLLAQADVLVHGYRPDALARLGLDAERRRAVRPGLVDVSLDAYGWSGPWQARRGYDSLVQMSSGIADAGMRGLGRDRPTSLPVQALDHATGYLLAAAAIRGLTRRLEAGNGSQMRASLARTAALLVGAPAQEPIPELAPEDAHDRSETTEDTPWGRAHRLKPPASVGEAVMRWDSPATRHGSSPAEWQAWLS